MKSDKFRPVQCGFAAIFLKRVALFLGLGTAMQRTICLGIGFCLGTGLAFSGLT